MNTVQLPKYSMLQKTPIYQLDTGELVPGLLRNVVFPDPTDQVYTITAPYANDWQKISSTLFGVAELWWVLTELNNIADPLFGLPSGAKIRIPTKARLQQLGVL